jgi:hypothetical protein
LADFLRTDHLHLQALQPSSDAAQELKLLTEDCQRHIRQQTRLVNQLTATLKAYYPRALEVAGVDDGIGAGVPARLSDAGGPDCADHTPVAAVGARPAVERGPHR